MKAWGGAGGEVVEPAQAFAALRAVGQHRVLVGGFRTQHGGVQLIDQRVVAAESGAPRDRVAHLAAGEPQVPQRPSGLHVAEAMVGEGGFPIARATVTGEAVLSPGPVERSLVDCAIRPENLGETQRDGLTGRDASLHLRPAGEVATEVEDALAIVQAAQFAHRYIGDHCFGFMLLRPQLAGRRIEDVGDEPAALAFHRGCPGIESTAVPAVLALAQIDVFAVVGASVQHLADPGMPGERAGAEVGACPITMPGDQHATQHGHPIPPGAEDRCEHVFARRQQRGAVVDAVGDALGEHRLARIQHAVAERRPVDAQDAAAGAGDVDPGPHRGAGQRAGPAQQQHAPGPTASKTKPAAARPVGQTAFKSGRIGPRRPRAAAVAHAHRPPHLLAIGQRRASPRHIAARGRLHRAAVPPAAATGRERLGGGVDADGVGILDAALGRTPGQSRQAFAMQRSDGVVGAQVGRGHGPDGSGPCMGSDCLARTMVVQIDHGRTPAAAVVASTTAGRGPIRLVARW